jgi:hypothetical protein
MAHEFDVKGFRAYVAEARRARSRPAASKADVAVAADPLTRVTMWVSDYVAQKADEVANGVVDEVGPVGQVAGVVEWDHASAHRVVDGGILDGLMNTLSRQVVKAAHQDPAEARKVGAVIAAEIAAYVEEEIAFRQAQAQLQGMLMQAAQAVAAMGAEDDAASMFSPRVLN